MTRAEEKRVSAKQKNCCGEKRGGRGGDDCDFRYFPQGPAWADMIDYARDENLWLRKYVEAWHIATENGYSRR